MLGLNRVLSFMNLKTVEHEDLFGNSFMTFHHSQLLAPCFITFFQISLGNMQVGLNLASMFYAPSVFFSTTH